MWYRFLYLSVFLNCFLGTQSNASEFKTFNNLYCGYQIQYPSDWRYFTDDPDQEPVEQASDVIFTSKDPNKNKTNNFEQSVSTRCYGDGTDADYIKSKKDIDEIFYRNRPQTDPTKFKETVINGNKAEIILQVRVKDKVFIYLLIYCERNNRIFRLSRSKSFDKNFPNLDQIVKNSYTVEKLFSPVQQAMINSFKCPAADFVYKAEKKKK